MNGKIDFFPLHNKKVISVRQALKECPRGTSYGSKNILKLWKYLRIGANGSTIPPSIRRKYGYNSPCFSCTKVDPNKPLATILKEVAGNGGLFHWSEKRRLYVSELKRLSTFPDTFKLKGKEEMKIKRIGNAVPPKFIEAIAIKTMSNLKELGINKEEYTVISLFAGCGGSSLGYKMAGFKEVLAIDFEKNAVETFKLNFPEVPIWQKDIRQIRGEEILNFCNIKEGELDVLDGSPPCQGFSTAGKRKVYDKRNDLVLEYIRLVDELQPKVFIMENVSGMVKGTMKGLFKEYMLKMKALNYVVKCKLMNAKYYNVPQSRERLIWIGVRKDLGKEGVFPKSNKKLINVKEAFKGLKEEKGMFQVTGKTHELMKKLKQGENASKICKGSWFGTNRLSNYKPAITILKEGALWGRYANYIHPIEDRSLSLSEVKRLGAFPDTFMLLGEDKLKWALIGNSVPPNFMYAISKTVKEEILK